MKLFLVLLFLVLNSVSRTSAQVTDNSGRFWNVQSIDTMKYSRDRSREFLSDISGAREKIAQQIGVIANTGATHVAIGTPYDGEFLPILQLWVQIARENNLKVWFRGNWSGWEGWFDYSAIARPEHLVKTQAFIRENADLFQDGDIFTACPECENGGAGDPRSKTNLSGYRDFLIAEHIMLEDEFNKLDKKVRVNFNSMNKDVAQLVMDEDTTKKLGNIVAIDHYVASAVQIAFDSSQLAKISGGKIVLSEFGSPIPDLHGNQTEVEQAEWLDDALLSFVSTPEIVALNYWTSFDGSTALWKNNGNKKLASSVLKKYYKPKTASGYILDEKQKPLQSVEIISQYRSTFTDEDGFFIIPYLFDDESMTVRKTGYDEGGFLISNVGGKIFTLSLVPENQSFLSQIFYLLVNAVKFW